MVQLLKESMYEFFGPLTMCKRNVDQEECHAPKSEELSFFNIFPTKAILQKQSSLTILLASLSVFACFHLEFQQARLQWTRGRGEDEEPYFALRMIHVCEACCGHISIIFARRMGELRDLSLVYESMGHEYRSIWSQE